jgi:hypothetical protein
VLELLLVGVAMERAALGMSGEVWCDRPAAHPGVAVRPPRRAKVGGGE